jgi:hypothetical protein
MVRLILPLRKFKTNRDVISFKDSLAKRSILAFLLTSPAIHSALNKLRESFTNIGTF